MKKKSHGYIIANNGSCPTGHVGQAVKFNKKRVGKKRIKTTLRPIHLPSG